MFPTFGGNTVSPGQVSYASFSLTASISLDWPNFVGTGTRIFALVMDITANAGGYSITFPNATNVGNGTTALLRNTGAQTITILANDGSTITSIAAGVAKFLYLQSNTTAAGSWGLVTFGTGTSSADASILAGYGLQAIGATLNQAHQTATTSGVITVAAPSDLAKVYVAIGGSVAANLPTSSSAGDKFFVFIKNDGTGTVTITPSGADTVDNAVSVALGPNDSAMICSLGSANAWVTVGLGRAVSFAFTQLVKSVAGGVDVTLSAAECSNKLMTFTGLLTGNINVIVTSTVSVYYVFNNTTGPFSITVKTAAGAGMAVAQGTHDLAVCDATNVYRGVTNTAATTAFSAGSAGAPSITFIGSTASGFYLSAPNIPGVSANGFEIMSWNGPASSVNWLDVFSSVTTAAPIIAANGSDASVGITLKTKGTGAAALISLVDGSGNNMGVWGTVASAVNYLKHLAAATGTNPSVTAAGTDGNIGIRLVPKGTGKLQLTDGTDVTKIGQFDLSGLTTGQTRTYALPDYSATLATIQNVQQAIFSQQTYL